MRPVLRLLADDLTGALDTAAALAGLCGPVPVPLSATSRPTGSIALDSATREATRADAVARVAQSVGLLAGGDIAFKKVDSLLRGHVVAEIAVCLFAGPWRHCILAPAFPAQGRVTRGARQVARQPDGTWQAVGPADLIAMLATEGIQAHAGRLDVPLPEGVSVFDAETEMDLVRIAALGRAVTAPVLWCGTGGLAGALAEPERVVPDPRFVRPVLGLFGSDQRINALQLAACGDLALRLSGSDPEEAMRVARLMDTRGAAMVSLDLPPDLGRAASAALIAGTFTSLLRRLAWPGTLIISGGETLRGVCGGLGAEAAVATGLVMPGLPRAVLHGGRWDGLSLVTKSGAFGPPGLWRDLFAASGLAAGPDPKA